MGFVVLFGIQARSCIVNTAMAIIMGEGGGGGLKKKKKKRKDHRRLCARGQCGLK